MFQCSICLKCMPLVFCLYCKLCIPRMSSSVCVITGSARHLHRNKCIKDASSKCFMQFQPLSSTFISVRYKFDNLINNKHQKINSTIVLYLGDVGMLQYLFVKVVSVMWHIKVFNKLLHLYFKETYDR